MGLSQADADRSRNVSRSGVHCLWNQYQTEASVSRRHVPGRPRTITPARDHLSLFRHEGEEGFWCRNCLKTTLQHQGEEYPLVRREGVFRIHGSMQGDQLCVYPSTDDREGPAYLGQENTFPGPDSDGHLYSLQTNPDLHWRVIQNVCSSGGNKAHITSLRYHPSKIVERHSYRGGGIMAWAEI
ncbi:uncharacterized protein TNCV_1581721 [Trichonephila clavipes]|nr:uncharacterized protein TNCV_1581721 [Trichonephila clavipes]